MNGTQMYMIQSFPQRAQRINLHILGTTFLITQPQIPLLFGKAIPHSTVSLLSYKALYTDFSSSLCSKPTAHQIFPSVDVLQIFIFFWFQKKQMQYAEYLGYHAPHPQFLKQLLFSGSDFLKAQEAPRPLTVEE